MLSYWLEKHENKDIKTGSDADEYLVLIALPLTAGRRRGGVEGSLKTDRWQLRAGGHHELINIHLNISLCTSLSHSAFTRLDSKTSARPVRGGTVGLVLDWQGLPPLKYATNVGLNLLNINPLGCQLECRIFCHNYHTYHGLKGSPGQILSRPPCTLLNVQIKLFIDKTEELPQGVIKITTTHQPAKHRHIIRASHPVLIVDLRDFLWQDISMIKVGQNIWYLTAARRWARLFVQENIHWLET